MQPARATHQSSRTHKPAYVHNSNQTRAEQEELDPCWENFLKCIVGLLFPCYFCIWAREAEESRQHRTASERQAEADVYERKHNKWLGSMFACYLVRNQSRARCPHRRCIPSNSSRR